MHASIEGISYIADGSRGDGNTWFYFGPTVF